MGGWRIRHPKLRDCTVIVPHPGNALRGEKPKDFHIRVDRYGHAFVSAVVWDRLQEAVASGAHHGFVLDSWITNPPHQRLGLPDGRAPHFYRVVGTDLVD